MTEQDEDMRVLRQAGDRLCVSFLMAHLKTPREVVQALLQFTGGRLPSSADETRTLLLTSYANLVCVDLEKLTVSDVQPWYDVLKKYTK